MPLVNASEDADIEYLSDGSPESLINALARVPKLRVMARSTVFRYKGLDVDPQRGGVELNVRAVLIGRMQKVQDRFSVSAELVDVTDGSQLWGEQYRGAARPVFFAGQNLKRHRREIEAEAEQRREAPAGAAAD